MTETQTPIVCPKYQSKNVAEKSENIFKTVWFKWSDEMGLYTRAAEDSKTYGDSYLACAQCGQQYDQEIYAEWLERL